MYHDAFERIDLEERKQVLEKLNSSFDGIDFDAEHCTILSSEIPFYKGYRFLDIADTLNTQPIHRYILMSASGDSTILDWTNKPIYALNKSAPIKLSKSNIGDYVRFFFKHVRGPEGVFILAENIDDLNWKEDPPSSARKALSQMLKSLTLLSKSLDGIYHLETTILFKDSLFQCQIYVSSDGMISIDQEELLVEEMPILDAVIGQ